MKIYSILLLTIALQAAAFGQHQPVFRVNAIEIKGKTAFQTEKMKRAARIFEQVLNDPEFQKELATKTFKSDRDDDLVPDPTAPQVIEKIYAAAEKYNPEPNHAADIYWYAEKKSFWKKLTGKCNTIGYGYPGERKIFTYTCLIDQEDSMAELVGNLAHEWSHKLGFKHRDEYHPGKYQTVPYVFGDLVEEHAAKWIKAKLAGNTVVGDRIGILTRFTE
jgi:hypothetical protein